MKPLLTVVTADVLAQQSCSVASKASRSILIILIHLSHSPIPFKQRYVQHNSCPPHLPSSLSIRNFLLLQSNLYPKLLLKALSYHIKHILQVVSHHRQRIPTCLPEAIGEGHQRMASQGSLRSLRHCPPQTEVSHSLFHCFNLRLSFQDYDPPRYSSHVLSPYPPSLVLQNRPKATKRKERMGEFEKERLEVFNLI